MNWYIRSLLIGELIIGFGLALFLWVWGVLVTPALVMSSGVALFTGSIAEAFSLMGPLIAVIGGGFGLWGLYNLALKVLFPDRAVMAPHRLLLVGAVGSATLVLAVLLLELQGIEAIMVLGLPLWVAAHFLYMARKYVRKAFDR